MVDKFHEVAQVLKGFEEKQNGVVYVGHWL